MTKIWESISKIDWNLYFHIVLHTYVQCVVLFEIQICVRYAIDYIDVFIIPIWVHKS